MPTLLHVDTPSSRLQVLMAYPELECWTGWHWVYVGVGTVGMVVYVFGLPCGIGLILYRFYIVMAYVGMAYIVMVSD